MREELADRSNPVGLIVACREQVGHSFEELVYIAQKQVVLVAIVLVKGRAADLRAIKDFLNSYVVERLREQQSNQSIAEPVARPSDAPVDLLSG